MLKKLISAVVSVSNLLKIPKHKNHYMEFQKIKQFYSIRKSYTYLLNINQIHEFRKYINLYIKKNVRLCISSFSAEKVI